MRNSWKLGALTAICASLAFIGCGDDDNGGDTDNGGSGGSSTGGKAGSGGGGKAGQNTGGSSAGKGGGGGTPNGGSGGSSAGKGGSAPEGGSGTEGGAGGGESLGGGGGEPSVPECTDGELGAGGGEGEGGAGGAGAAATTAVVLIDSVVVKSGNNTVADWLFADGTTISDATNYPADKWSRIIFDPGSLGDDAGAHCTFLGCDGDPGAGSLKAVVPFSDANQYFELGVPFAAADYSNTTVTARVKLVSGGKPDAACPVRAQLYSTGTTPKNDAPGFALVEGDWVTITMELGAGFAGTDRVGIRLNTYGC